MILLDGKSLSQQILSELKLKIKDRRSEINLHVVLVGDDPASVKYVSLKEKRCQEVGIDFTLHHLSENTTESDLIQLINQLNNNPSVTGYIVQLPLPDRLSKDRILPLINPDKDVDGLNTNSKILPAVVTGIITLLKNYKIDFNNKNIVILNDSDLIGQPLKKEFEREEGRVTLVNKFTQDIPDITKNADILISATGVKNVITSDMVKDQAVVVDVANGDVDFANVSPKCSFITPTFGGIGPMTIASLLQNTYNAYLLKIKE